jgi:hypothetical protein
MVGGLGAAQLTVMLPTLELVTVPEPFATTQVWIGEVGCVLTVTA